MDAIKLGVILDNLLSNAVKFTSEGGNIRLSLFYRQESGLLEICVSDTGAGIPQQDIPYIFQRFFQSPHSGSKEGTGIGLYLVKTYTELHGGSINGVTSEKGKGTSIGLSIPVAAVEEDEIPAAQSKKQLESLPVLKHHPSDRRSPLRCRPECKCTLRTVGNQQQADLPEDQTTDRNVSGGIYQIYPNEEGCHVTATREIHRCRSDVYGRLFQSLLFLQMFSG